MTPIPTRDDAAHATHTQLLARLRSGALASACSAAYDRCHR